jgi:hypothetical protein
MTCSPNKHDHILQQTCPVKYTGSIPVPARKSQAIPHQTDGKFIPVAEVPGNTCPVKDTSSSVQNTVLNTALETPPPKLLLSHFLPMI